MILLFSRLRLVFAIGGLGLLLLLELHHLDALGLQQPVLLVGVLAERGLSAVDPVGEERGERGVDGLHHRDELRVSSAARPHVERAAVVEGEAQAVLVGPGEDVGADGGSLGLSARGEAYDEAAEGGHDLPESVDLGAEVLVGAVGDEDHAVRGVKERSRTDKDM